MPDTIHGVGINIYGLGIILTGDSGIGKSELALELLSRGHKLIADDMLNMSSANNQLFMHNPIQKFIMYIKDIGFIDINSMFSFNSTLSTSKVDFMVRLSQNISPPSTKQKQNKLNILDNEITEYIVSTGSNKPLATIIETLTKYHKQLSLGIDSHKEFINYHTNMIMENQTCN